MGSDVIAVDRGQGEVGTTLALSLSAHEVGELEQVVAIR